MGTNIEMKLRQDAGGGIGRKRRNQNPIAIECLERLAPGRSRCYRDPA